MGWGKFVCRFFLRIKLYSLINCVYLLYYIIIKLIPVIVEVCVCFGSLLFVYLTHRHTYPSLMTLCMCVCVCVSIRI